ncbi:NUDIX hydrolase [Spirosoma utsteinense]|uniref:GDP-mannose pyrophosphatase n=1 Tax=Spirosoma utsteinense TaxID=2585773 RepID=A0ABR6WCF1_9BACT|nr:NUDIX hydrolase [Spirosoma utsteinense]MBC3787814.1 8-oxo-dGTP pyrophosphatase MutT (NUDIX family) [Spirosoma utsteinense]MBC3793601.1 8-oxo-dGTP pyrophosphatase MutT (NUDIX family) [Spirosoma utsteinense]
MIPENDPKHWQVEHADYLVKTPWLTVRQDAVRLPNGSFMPDYYLFEYPNWVNVVAVTTDGQLILVRQYRHGIAGVHYELCAGTVDPVDGTSEAGLLLAAQRELLEETGYSGGEWQPFMTLSANTGTHTNLNYTFLATGVVWQQPQQLDDTEDIAVHLVSPEQALAIVDSGQMVQAMCVAPLLRYLCGLSSGPAGLSRSEKVEQD